MSALTIKDIAKICNVSVSTVSRAMNDDPGINKDTKARVLQVMEEYNYVPNNSARNLKMIESNTIAVLVKGMDNPFFQSMLGYFAEADSSMDYNFIIQDVRDEQDEVSVAELLVKEKRLKGLIFLGGLIDNPGERLDKIGIPYVRCTGATYIGDTGFGGASISIDDEKEAYRAVDHLCKKGHKRIAIITSREGDNSVGELRLKGYKRALKENGIAFDKKLVRYTKESLQPYSIPNGYEVMKELLEEGIDCTALFAVSDMTAFGAYKAIQEAGYRIPEDYSVIGFDGLEMTKYFQPSLSTMEQPRRKMIRASIDSLLQAIDGKEYAKQILFDATLLDRDSVKDLN